MNALKLYKVLLMGQNFKVDNNGAPATMGFHTTRFVDEYSRDMAECMAVNLVCIDKDLGNIVMNDLENNPPLLHIINSEEVGVDHDKTEKLKSLEPKFIWFEDDEKQ